MQVNNKQLEYIKCFKDKSRVYFIENYLSTFDATERRDVPFMLFQSKKVFLQSLNEHNNTIAIKHRQCGVTTISSGWITGQITFASKKSPETVLCIANKLEQAVELVNKIITFLGQVPRWMWGDDYYSPDPDSEKNKKSIFVKKNRGYVELFNGCKIYARSSGENAARGISAVTILIFDEAAFIQNGTTVYAQAIATTNSVSNAKVIMVSTPNGKDPLYYQIYSKAVKRENNYHVVEFRWFQDLRYNRHLKWYKKDETTGEIKWDIDEVIDSKGNIIYNEERWRKLEREGWTPESPWYINTCKTFNNDEQKIAQEINVSFMGSADNVVPVEVIEAQSLQNVIKITPDWDLRDPFIKETWIWKDPIKGHRYVCACDPSSGSGQDRTAIEILDVDAIDENGMPYVEQVLAYYGKMTGDEIGEMVFNYATVYNNALVVVEGLGGYGDATILTLMNMGYQNLYYDDPGLKTYTVQRTYSKFNLKMGDKLPGFRTNNMRIQMISNFVAMLKDNTFRVRSERVISELETWVFKNGRPNHLDGEHDDSLTCLSMGLFVMQYSMIRSDRTKSKDVAMMHSWKMNKGYSTPYSYNRNLDLSRNSNVPYLSRPYHETKISDERKIQNAMIMIGGFKVNKP